MSYLENKGENKIYLPSRYNGGYKRQMIATLDDFQFEIQLNTNFILFEDSTCLHFCCMCQRFLNITLTHCCFIGLTTRFFGFVFLLCHSIRHSWIKGPFCKAVCFRSHWRDPWFQIRLLLVHCCVKWIVNLVCISVKKYKEINMWEMMSFVITQYVSLSVNAISSAYRVKGCAE